MNEDLIGTGVVYRTTNVQDASTYISSDVAKSIRSR